LRKLPAKEHSREITVPGQSRFAFALEIAFRELGFDQQASEPHVHFGAVEPALDEGDARFVAELRRAVGFRTQQVQHLPVGGYTGVAEDIHQQGVGAVAGIKFAPAPLSARQRFELRVGLGQPPAPLRVLQNGAIASGKKVAVLPGAGALKNYGGHTAVTELMGQAMGVGVFLAAVTKLRA